MTSTRGGVVTPEEVRSWYQSRGIPVGSKALSRKHIEGWNRANPERPYVAGVLIHGTRAGYQDHGCRCETCTAAGSAYHLAVTHNRRDKAAS